MLSVIAKPHVLIGMCIEMRSAYSTNLISDHWIHCILYTVYIQSFEVCKFWNSEICNFMFKDHQAFDFIHEHSLPSMLHMWHCHVLLLAALHDVQSRSLHLATRSLLSLVWCIKTAPRVYHNLPLGHSCVVKPHQVSLQPPLRLVWWLQLVRSKHVTIPCKCQTWLFTLQLM